MCTVEYFVPFSNIINCFFFFLGDTFHGQKWWGSPFPKSLCLLTFKRTPKNHQRVTTSPLEQNHLNLEKERRHWPCWACLLDAVTNIMLSEPIWALAMDGISFHVLFHFCNILLYKTKQRKDTARLKGDCSSLPLSRPPPRAEQNKTTHYFFSFDHKIPKSFVTENSKYGNSVDV